MLIFHFVMNLQAVAKALSLMFLSSASTSAAAAAAPSDTTLMEQVLLLGWCLAGLPIILMAIWGVYQRIETLLRLYLNYQIVSCLLDLCVVFNKFVLSSPCQNMPAVVQEQGKSFACGIARGANATIVVLITLIQVYMIFIVWSHCEDLAEGGGADFSDLRSDFWGRPMSEQALQNKKYKSEHHFAATYGSAGGTVGGLFGVLGMGGDSGGNDAGAGAASGFNGSQKIFGGRYHEMNYPPVES